jgi:hypothetical protein
MKTFAEVAPALDALGFTEAQANNFIDNKLQPATPATPPELTKEKALLVAPKLIQGIDVSGGYRAIADEIGLTKAQVKLVVDQLRAWQAAREESEEPAE